METIDQKKLIENRNIIDKNIDRLVGVDENVIRSFRARNSELYDERNEDRIDDTSYDTMLQDLKSEIDDSQQRIPANNAKRGRVEKQEINEPTMTTTTVFDNHFFNKQYRQLRKRWQVYQRE